MNDLRLALDRNPANRYYDDQGFMHVRVCNLSKGNICPYYGREIPGWEALGLDPERVYQMFRHPEELAKAADSFNGLPLLAGHKGTSADDHPKDRTVGSTGSTAAFVAPYLQNSLAIWTKEAIAGVESGQIIELSCGYAYTPDMQPGVERGLVFDGVMRAIKGNHVALVEAGRAGPDVLVADSELEPIPMSKREAALEKLLKPHLAADAQVNIAALILAMDEEKDDETEAEKKETEDKRAKDKKARDARAKDRKARDAARDARRKAKDEKDCEAEDEEEEKDDREEAEDEDPDMEAEDRRRAKDARDARKHARDKRARDRAKDKNAHDQQTMDAAITKGVSEGVAAAMAKRDALDEAKRMARPHVGELTGAFDSAEAVHKFVLEQAGVDLTDVPAVAYKALVQNLNPEPKKIALDAKARDSVADFFPGLARYAA